MNHEEAVEAFMKEAQEQDPEKYQEVCDKYPTQNKARQAVVRRREITVGHLGLSPSRISFGIAARNDLEALQEDD